MAKKNPGRKVEEEDVTDDEDDGTEVPQSAPSGFGIRVERVMADGWMLKAPGNVIHGRLGTEYFMKKNKKGEETPVFTVKLMSPCKASTGSKKEGTYEEVVLEKGALVNIEGAVFRDLEAYCNNGGVYNIWFKYTGKEPFGNGDNQMWKGDGPHLQQLREPRPNWKQEAKRQKAKAQAPGRQEYDPGDTDDIPF